MGSSLLALPKNFKRSSSSVTVRLSDSDQIQTEFRLSLLYCWEDSGKIVFARFRFFWPQCEGIGVELESIPGQTSLIVRENDSLLNKQPISSYIPHEWQERLFLRQKKVHFFFTLEFHAAVRGE
jgi:hypothetical protein